MPTMNLSRIRRRALLAAALPAALAAVALPSTAHAGLASVVAINNTRILGYQDGFGAGENNDVTVRFANGDVTIEDAGATVRAGAGCRIVVAAAVCPLDPREGIAVKRIEILVGDGNDEVRYQAPHRGIVDVGAGNDVIFGGQRRADSAGRIESVLYQDLGGGFDTISYAEADRGVTVNAAASATNFADDGRPGDNENIGTSSQNRFEVIVGSNFDDTLFGAPHSEIFNGGGGRDAIAGGDGDETFITEVRDGADDYHGGPGRDFISYGQRAQPLSISLDNTANDGEGGEGDNVRSNVENVMGGSGDDTISSLGAFSRLDGRAGRDTLLGGPGPDTLLGGPGIDSIEAGTENDVVEARDGDPDFVDCGGGSDSLARDAVDGPIKGCETGQVGTLRLARKAIAATVGKPVRVKLSWRHPQSWRKLRSVELSLYRAGAPVGTLEVRPDRMRISAHGAVQLVRDATRLTHRGKVATARLALKLDPSLAGARLRLEVEAADTRGRRQLERNAGVIRVAP